MIDSLIRTGYRACMPDSITIIRETRDWVEHFVLHHNLCPFAHQPFREQRIAYHSTEHQRMSPLCEDFHAALSSLEHDLAQTTLLIYAGSEPLDFEDFLDLSALLELELQALGLQEKYQLATFHPSYQFAGVTEDDPANATNQSPHPMWHLLRCEDVSSAIASHPDTLSIPERNVQLLRRLHDEIDRH